MTGTNDSPARPPAPARPLAVDAAGLAELLSMSLRSVRHFDAAEKLPAPVRVGRCNRWAVAEVEAWLAAGAPDRAAWEALKRGRAS